MASLLQDHAFCDTSTPPPGGVVVRADLFDAEKADNVGYRDGNSFENAALRWRNSGHDRSSSGWHCTASIIRP